MTAALFLHDVNYEYLIQNLFDVLFLTDTCMTFGKIAWPKSWLSADCEQ